MLNSCSFKWPTFNSEFYKRVEEGGLGERTSNIGPLSYKTPPIPPLRQRGNLSNPILLKNKSGPTTEPPAPSHSPKQPPPLPPRKVRVIQNTRSGNLGDTRDAPVVVERVEDMGRYHDCLKRKGEVILGCGHMVWEKCFERDERCRWCIGCRMMLGL